MGKLRQKFEQNGFDKKAYQSYFHQNQSEYIRKKLRVIKFYQEKKETKQISQELNVHIQSIPKYVNAYISGGFELLCQKDERPRASFVDSRAIPRI